jgi:hypothetical protein
MKVNLTEIAPFGTGEDNEGETRMKPLVIASVLIGTVALVGMLAGCNRTEETTPAATPPAAGTTATQGVALGTEQTAGPFQVTLSTEPAAPKAGDTRFTARVTRDGKTVTGATVKVDLSMPSMNMGGPSVTLKPRGDHYEGTAKLGMGGAWQAKTTVSAGSDTGTAVYEFTAGQ